MPIFTRTMYGGTYWHYMYRSIRTSTLAHVHVQLHMRVDECIQHTRTPTSTCVLHLWQHNYCRLMDKRMRVYVCACVHNCVCMHVRKMCTMHACFYLVQVYI